MKKKEAKQILIDCAKRVLKGSGVGLSPPIPVGKEAERIKEAIKLTENFICPNCKVNIGTWRPYKRCPYCKEIVCLDGCPAE